MKKLLLTTLALLPLISLAPDANARGGFSSAGRGSFSGSRSFSSPTRSYGSRSITTTRRYYSSGYYGHRYYGSYYHPFMFGPFGMGYGYSNGLIEGMILGDLMHPQGTTVYSGPGYSGNALLYPNGMVVNPDGYQVGTYAGGNFTPMSNGPMVAQQAPQMQPAPGENPQRPTLETQLSPQPVLVQQQSSGFDAGMALVIGILMLALFLMFIAIIF